jgi:pyroglutamyl-peptidase
MRILVTGFEPFGSLSRNPSEEIVRELTARAQAAGERKFQLVGEILPTEYDGAARRLTRLIEESRPDAILSLGVATKSDAIRVERLALNLDDAEAPDNAGELRSGQPIVPGAPMVYFSTLPIEAMVQMLREAGLPAAISNHAGTYVCNHVFYTARHLFTESERQIPCGFVHVPEVPHRRSSSSSQNGRLTVEALADGLELLLRLLAREWEVLTADRVTPSTRGPRD